MVIESHTERVTSVVILIVIMMKTALAAKIYLALIV